MAYVYGHYKADTNELFYIGKGTGKRAWKKQHRTKHWRNIVKKHGLVVKILNDDLTDEEALELEKRLIAEIGLSNLVNLLEGGEGVTSDFAKKLFSNDNFRKKHKLGIISARSKMSDIKRQQLKNDPEYLKKLVSVLQDPKTMHKRYEKIECEVCGTFISKNAMDRHRSSKRSCREEYRGMSNTEITKIKAHEKYKQKTQRRKSYESSATEY